MPLGRTEEARAFQQPARPRECLLCWQNYLSHHKNCRSPAGVNGGEKSRDQLGANFSIDPGSLHLFPQTAKAWLRLGISILIWIQIAYLPCWDKSMITHLIHTLMLYNAQLPVRAILESLATSNLQITARVNSRLGDEPIAKLKVQLQFWPSLTDALRRCSG